MSTTPILGLDEVLSGQGDKFITHNDALNQLEAVIIRVKSKSNGGAPASPVEGDTYVVDIASGAWVSATVDDIAHYYGGGWNFYTPKEGWRVWVNDKNRVHMFDGTDWDTYGLNSGGATLTQSSVLFVDASGNITEDNANFNYNDGTNTLTIANLVTNSTTTQISTTNLTVTDALIKLADGNATDSLDMGIVCQRSSNNVAWIYDETSDEWSAIYTTEDGTTSGNVTIADYAPIHAGGAIFDDNVGIGGTPTEKLTVTGGNIEMRNGTPIFTIADSGDTGTAAIGWHRWEDSAGTGLAETGFFSNTDYNFSIFNRQAGDIILGTSNTERMRLSAAGKLTLKNGTYSNPSAGEGQLVSRSSDGLILSGNGSINDLLATNNNGNTVWNVPTGTTQMMFGPNCKISTGNELSPDVDPGGICINHGANDGNALSLKNSDVAHGMTSIAETDTYGGIKKASNTGGGLRLDGFTEEDIGVRFLAHATTPATSDTGSGTVEFYARKKSGTSAASLADTENIVAVRNDGNTKAVIKGNGDIVTQGGVRLSGGTDLLDTYEEGTWTPVIADASSGGNTATFTNNEASYTRIGRQVTVHFNFTDIDTTGMTGANAIAIRGLPFTNGSSVAVLTGNVRTDNITIAEMVIPQVGASSTVFNLLESVSGASASTIKVSDLTSGTADIRGTLTYYV